MTIHLSAPRSSRYAAQAARARAAKAGYSTCAVFANEDGYWQFYYEDEEA